MTAIMLKVLNTSAVIGTKVIEKVPYPLRGVKIVDGAVYLPAYEIVNFCRYYPKLTSDQLSILLKEAIENLQKDEAVLKVVPVLNTIQDSK